MGGTARFFKHFLDFLMTLYVMAPLGFVKKNLQKFHRFSCLKGQVRTRYNYSGSDLGKKSRTRIHNTAYYRLPYSP